MSLIDEIIGDAADVENDIAGEANADVIVEAIENIENDGEPSADDYQDLGE